ncbi:hypothetical protein A5636_08775 [Mycobacterium asiaticum]|uniref:Helix-turn-helix domain-containing protein n=1 Tax=Mycobacterium asiaticum TaxID=1790 RepID=A0A1A3MY13_MYCAS|nr:hypothetical protein A5636_08775 [Mycobacterium asiaticum]
MTYREEITLKEAAARKRCNLQTIRRMIASGQLPAHRFGPRLIRIYADDLEKVGHPLGSAGAA